MKKLFYSLIFILLVGAIFTTACQEPHITPKPGYRNYWRGFVNGVEWESDSVPYAEIDWADSTSIAFFFKHVLPHEDPLRNDVCILGRIPLDRIGDTIPLGPQIGRFGPPKAVFYLFSYDNAIANYEVVEAPNSWLYVNQLDNGDYYGSFETRYLKTGGFNSVPGEVHIYCTEFRVIPSF